jgi:hypothetical protein
MAQPADQQELQPAGSGLSLEMEQELYRLLGRLLGTLEAMATDNDTPVEGRQRQWLQEALDCGHELKEHVEALAFLAAPDAAARLNRSPYSVRRMVEHAVRAAGWQASERQVELRLPNLDAWAERMVEVDVRAMDRVIRGACEYLVLSLPRGGAVEVRLAQVQGALRIDLLGDTNQRTRPEGQAPSQLLQVAWQHIARLHHGRLLLDVQELSAEIWLPLSR